MALSEDRLDLARSAAARRDWDEALRLWNSIIRDFPEDVAGYLGKSEALLATGRLAEAERHLTDAKRRFADDEWVANGHAGIASRRQDWPEALKRWSAVCEQFPQHMMAYIGKGEALNQLGRFDAAEAVFSEAVERFPASDWIAGGHADMAARRRNWPEAFARWDAVRRQFPDHFRAYIGMGEALLELQRLDEADQVASEAVRRFPNNEWSVFAYATIASRRHDWDEALRRWDLMLERFPGDARAESGKAEALAQAAAAAQTVPDSGAEPQYVEPAEVEPAEAESAEAEPPEVKPSSESDPAKEPDLAKELEPAAASVIEPPMDLRQQQRHRQQVRETTGYRRGSWLRKVLFDPKS